MTDATAGRSRGAAALLAVFEAPEQASEQSSLLEAGLQRHANAAHVQNALSDDETKDEGGKDYGSPFLERTKSYGSFFKPQRPSAPITTDDATLLTAAMRQSPPASSQGSPKPQKKSLLRKASTVVIDAVAPPQTRRRYYADVAVTLAREAVVGGIAFFFVTVFAAAFASTTSADVSFLRPRGADLVRIATLGFVAGAPFVFFQKLP